MNIAWRVKRRDRRLMLSCINLRITGQSGLVLKIEDDKGEELLGGGPNEGGPDAAPQRGATP
jgi:hypothetical protein